MSLKETQKRGNRTIIAIFIINYFLKNIPVRTRHWLYIFCFSCSHNLLNKFYTNFFNITIIIYLKVSKEDSQFKI